MSPAQICILLLNVINMLETKFVINVWCKCGFIHSSKYYQNKNQVSHSKYLLCIIVNNLDILTFQLDHPLQSVLFMSNVLRRCWCV